jgi:hypothetical protein
VPVVLANSHFNTPFSRFRPNHAHFPTVRPLHDAIEEELESLGDIIYILIGVVQDTVRIEHVFNHALFDRVVLDPAGAEELVCRDRELIIRSTFDEERAWEALVEIQREEGLDIANDSALRRALEVALEALAAKSYARLVFPSDISAKEDSVLRSIIKVLETEMTSYQAALSRCGGDPDVDQLAFNEILRISYNFASDATTLIRLVSNICDLKPLLMWTTLGEHYALSAYCHGRGQGQRHHWRHTRALLAMHGTRRFTISSHSGRPLKLGYQPTP